MNSGGDLSSFSIMDLFRNEVKGLQTTFHDSLKALKGKAADGKLAEVISRSAHSMKGAARLVHLELIEKLSAAIEDLFNKIKDGKAGLNDPLIEEVLVSVDLACSLASVPDAEVPKWLKEHEAEINKHIEALSNASKEAPAVKKEAGAPASAPSIKEPGKKLNIDMSMVDLFRVEVEGQMGILNDGLIELEQGTADDKALEGMMRGAHSIKGAARVIGLDPIVTLAHKLEDCFVAAQKKLIILDPTKVDLLLSVVDLLAKVGKVEKEELESWFGEQEAVMGQMREALSVVISGGAAPAPIKAAPVVPAAAAVVLSAPFQEPAVQPALAVPTPPPVVTSIKLETPKEEAAKVQDKVEKVSKKAMVEAKEKEADRVLRVTAQNLNRLMGLAGESLVESRWLQPFANSLLQLKINQNDLASTFDILRESLKMIAMSEKTSHYLVEVQHKMNEIRQGLTERISELEMFIRRHASLSDRLYHEVIDSRMRPFSDGVAGFPRMVRDVARELGKKVRLEITGKSTPVDRDILEKLEAPLNHMLRNAVDHGIESPEERIAAGKNPEAVIRLDARHRAGMLAITVSDDGRGIDIEAIRKKVIDSNLAVPEMAASMTEAELIEFLFLPGFSTSKKVTEISGRGVGLDVVQSMVQEVSGVIRTTTEKGKGTTFHMQLPLTLSVIRALIADISGEPYAFPLARIDRVVLLHIKDIEIVENRQYFRSEGQNIGIVPGFQVLEMEEAPRTSDDVPVIVVSDRMNSYGLVVDKITGERELVVQEMDSRLGKVPDIASGALLENGDPVLIIDIEDSVRSIDIILHGSRLRKVGRTAEKSIERKVKRILVVDDSITVREVECRLLRNQGYDVDAAVDGMDGWNAIRLGSYDLVVSDIDMPRMNGIELVRMIKSDEKLKALPVVIVSYKEREEDRQKGMEAGANYYLTKSSFHDETLINVVEELIGKSRVK